ncbi:MAG: hypothetical protein LH616_16895, partial [Ilumatobacteraceae bacterium]|nr:hypothetical protein [Ilumatobacteraceae bacterium]
ASSCTDVDLVLAIVLGGVVRVELNGPLWHRAIKGSPRMISEVIFDGHRLGREIDSLDPRLPLPYLRERPTP